MAKAEKSVEDGHRTSKAERKRRSIDRGMKQIASINRADADAYGAVAVKWRHPQYLPHQRACDECPDHKERDGKYFLLKGTWATEKRLVKRGANPYYDDIDQVAERSGCQCWAEYIYDLDELPEDMRSHAQRHTSRRSAANSLPKLPDTDEDREASVPGFFAALRAWWRGARQR